MTTTRRLPALWQATCFTAIGAVMTVAYLAMYAVLRDPLGAQAANALAWGATAVVDTAANRRWTFERTGRAGAGRAQAEGLLVFGLGMAVTSGGLTGLDALVALPEARLELTVLLAANLAAGVLRFALLRSWVFAPGRAAVA